MKSTTLSLLALAAAGAYARGPGGDDDQNNDAFGGFGGFGGFPGSGNNGDGNGNGNGFGFGFGSAFGNGIGFDIGAAMRYRSIHGILAAIAFVGFFPLGAILMRVVPGRFAWILHALTQMVGYVLYIAAAGLGIYLIQMVRLPPTGASLLELSQTNAHPIIGLVVLVLVFFQPILGFIHHVRFKSLGRRTAWSHAHIWIGRAAITLGIINGGLGLQLAGAPNSTLIAYSVVGAVMWLLWVLAAIFGEFRRRRAAARTRTTMVVAPMNQPSPPYTPRAIYGGPPPVHTANTRGAGDVDMRAAKPLDRGTSVSSLSSAGSRRSHRN